MQIRDPQSKPSVPSIPDEQLNHCQNQLRPRQGHRLRHTILHEQLNHCQNQPRPCQGQRLRHAVLRHPRLKSILRARLLRAPPEDQQHHQESSD